MKVLESAPKMLTGCKRAKRADLPLYDLMYAPAREIFRPTSHNSDFIAHPVADLISRTLTKLMK
jgi:hypothetical protein